MLRPVASTLLLAFVLSAPLTAQQIRLEAESGRIIEGTIVSNDGTHVEVETADGSTRLPYANLTPMSQYRLHRARLGESGKGQLELAEWCVDAELYKQARRHYRMALEADATMADQINASLTKARKQAADELLGRAKDMQGTRPNEARQILTTIVQKLPLEEAATEAAQLLAQETEQRKASSLSHSSTSGEAPTGGERATRRDGEPFSDAAYATMAAVIEHYKKLLDHTHKGLTTSSQSGTIKEYEKGIAEGDRARKAVDEVRDQGAEGDEIAEAVELADAKLEEAIVDCRISLADEYLLRTSYKDADEVVKNGLAVYPKNERLLRARERVIAAANDNDGGPWFGGRRRGEVPVVRPHPRGR